MKQHITKDQHNDLGLEPMIKLEEWCLSKAYEPLELSIGQMIEFLDKHDKDKLTYVLIDSDSENNWAVNELCDRLWEAVKEVLEKS